MPVAHRDTVAGTGGATLVCVLISGFAAGLFDTNCYVLATGPGTEALVIDPGDDAVGTCEYYFAANDWTPAGVLLTHGHPGHSAAAHDLSGGWDIPVYVHGADRGLLAAQEFGEPEHVVEVADGQLLQLAGIEVAVTLIGGHTPGSVAYRVIADTDEGPVPVVFSGDTLLHRGLGHHCDGPGSAPSASALQDLADAVGAKLMVLPDETVVMPGHGTSTSIGAERRANPYLKDLTA